MHEAFFYSMKYIVIVLSVSTDTAIIKIIQRVWRVSPDLWRLPTAISRLYILDLGELWRTSAPPNSAVKLFTVEGTD